MLHPSHARPTTTFPSRLTSDALLSDASQLAAPGVNEPSRRHSAARCQIAAWTPRASAATPTMVLPSRLTLVAARPPMKMTPVVGIQ